MNVGPPPNLRQRKRNSEKLQHWMHNSTLSQHKKNSSNLCKSPQKRSNMKEKYPCNPWPIDIKISWCDWIE